jgi:hypothetical protein
MAAWPGGMKGPAFMLAGIGLFGLLDASSTCQTR